jgi:hypothetical protein
MGQHPCAGGDARGAGRDRGGSGGTRNISAPRSGTSGWRPNWPTCTAKRRRWSSPGLHRQRRDAVDAAAAVPRPDHLFRRAEPCLDDRGRAARRRREADLPAQRRGASARTSGGGRPGGAEADRLRSIYSMDGDFGPIGKSATWRPNSAR